MTQKALQTAVRLSNGREMPIMGLGTLFHKDPKAITHAITNVGYRNIDTATITMNEAQVGKGIEEAIATGAVERSDIFLATKLWHNSYGDPETTLRKSLKALKTDYVDLYYLHWPNNFFTNPQVPMHVLWARLEGLVDKGLCKGLAVSNFNTQLLADIMTYAKHKPLANQICLNPACAQTDLVKFLHDYDIAPVAYSPLGRLGSKMGPQGDNLTEKPVIQAMAAKYGRSETQVILNWGMCRGHVVIPKASDLGHQADNFAAQTFQLSEEDVAEITSTLDEGKQLFLHTPDFKYNVYA